MPIERLIRTFGSRSASSASGGMGRCGEMYGGYMIANLHLRVEVGVLGVERGGKHEPARGAVRRRRVRGGGGEEEEWRWWGRRCEEARAGARTCRRRRCR